MQKTTLYILSLSMYITCCLSTAQAEIYQFIDEKGVVHFTNVPTRSKGQQRPTKIHHETTRTESPETTSLAAAAARPAKAKSRNNPSDSIPASYAEYIDKACERYGVDPSLVHAVVRVESGFNPFALSNKGAMGLMQLMPRTATDLNVKNSFSPQENIEGGVKYLRTLLDRYEGNVTLALAAYNAGETSVKKWGTVPPYKETRDYVKKIMKLYNGSDATITPRQIQMIYVGYSADGVLLLTDNPSNHQGKQLRRKMERSL